MTNESRRLPEAIIYRVKIIRVSGRCDAVKPGPIIWDAGLFSRLTIHVDAIKSRKDAVCGQLCQEHLYYCEISDRGGGLIIN